mmetsp:Transcript_9992/g.31104  ORF Transcript_9992/g.31104 Transcript_9992/m.31104 type:complete len:213 (-) Transcript_9992:85-723(-)
MASLGWSPSSRAFKSASDVSLASTFPLTQNSSSKGVTLTLCGGRGAVVSSTGAWRSLTCCLSRSRSAAIFCLMFRSLLYLGPSAWTCACKATTSASHSSRMRRSRLSFVRREMMPAKPALSSSSVAWRSRSYLLMSFTTPSQVDASSSLWRLSCKLSSRSCSASARGRASTVVRSVSLALSMWWCVLPFCTHSVGSSLRFAWAGRSGWRPRT